MIALLDDQGREVGLFELGDAGLDSSTETWSGASFYSPTDPAPPQLLSQPVVAIHRHTVQSAPSCGSCRGGSETVDVVPVNGGALPSNLTSDTRIDAGVSIGWRELLIILIVAAAARYFELI